MKNPDHVVSQLQEAAWHIQEALREIESHKDDAECDAELAVHLGHILDHICYSWNARDLSDDECMRLTTEQKTRMRDGIPNFDVSRRLFRGTSYEG